LVDLESQDSFLILSSGSSVIASEFFSIHNRAANIHMFDPMDMPLVFRALRRAHVTISLPFKAFWLRGLRKYSSYKSLNVLIFDGIFWESVVEDVRRILPSADIKFYYWNQLSRPKLLNKVISSCSSVLTFDPQDAEKYDIEFYQTFCPTLDLDLAGCNDIYDLSFVGADKGRFDKINEIYSLINPMNYSLNFKVISKRLNNKNLDISLKEPVSLGRYNEIIARSRTVLELTCFGQSGLTLRAIAALRLGKKLITDNRNVLFFNEGKPHEQILVLNDGLSDISNIEAFLDSEYVPIDLAVFDDYLFPRWLEVIFEH
jgi:hypothetical protein